MSGVWVVETHADGDMGAPMAVLCLVATVQAGKAVVAPRLGETVRKRAVWKHPRPWVWELRWSRAKNACVVASLTLHEVRS